jgi:rRNA maturation RNase YbeY
MKIEINNRQSLRRIDRRKIRELVRLLLERVQALDPLRQWGELSLVFTDDAGIRPLNRVYFNDPGVTDVISFCYDPVPGDDDRITGEIVVNVERAAARGPRASRELALYLAHGCDHLTGADDQTPPARTRMRRRELRWLKAPETACLVDRLLQ